MDDRDLREQLLPRLVRLLDDPVDPNQVAAYVDGTLPPEDHRAVAARIESDPEALLLVRALEEDRRHVRVTRWRMVAVAATILLAVGIWRIGGPARRGAEGDLATRLASATGTLKQREPELFEAFEPLPDAVLRASPAVVRGGATWLFPVGTQASAPEVLRWHNAQGSSRVRVSIRGAGVDWTREVRGEEVAAPELGPGRYVVRLRALDALAGQEVRRVFEIADAEAQARLERALRSIREHVGGDLAELLAAHYATQQGFHRRARALSDALAGESGDVADAARKLSQHLEAIAPSVR